MGRYPLIGRLAIENGFLSKQELDKALSGCSGNSQDPDKELIRYLVSNKLVSSNNIDKLIAAIETEKDQNSEIKFGAIAIKKGLISRNNLDFILEEQENDIVHKKETRLLGDMLIEAGMITDKQRNLVLEIQNKLIRKGKENSGHRHDDREKEDLLMEPEPLTHGLKLQITMDFLAAFLIKTDKFDKSCTVNIIKDILSDRDIIYGVVTDEMIIHFLKSSVFEKKPFRIARGMEPVHGRSAEIKYFFDTEPLKAGDVNMDGQIDFKDRGRIPQVDKGMVLAAKTPMVEAQPGRNIYGAAIDVDPVSDDILKPGKGVELSPDGLQALAAVKGHPEIKASGEICVQEEYVIKGDVDYETGHIDYEGDIKIKGCIKSGFRVKGNNIKANEIDDGIIDAGGDLIISNGINSGRIYVQGNVTAKFIHKSNLTCVGDVSVLKEIIDAAIGNRGQCTMPSGKIISSRITSKMGVFVKDIGTKKGRPSIIRAGFDIFTEQELEENRTARSDLNASLEDMVKSIEKKKEELEAVEKEIDECDRLKSSSETFKEKIIYKMDSLKRSDAAIKFPEPVKETLKDLAGEIKKACKNLEICRIKQKELETQIKELTRKVGRQKLSIKKTEAKKQGIIKWIEENPGKPVINVSGIIMEKTIINGVHSRKILEEQMKNVTFEEKRDTTPGAGPNAYMIDIVQQ